MNNTSKPTATAIVAAFFLVVGVIGLIWTLLGGAEDGSKLVMYWFGGMGIAIAILSRVLGGGWFTDSAGGR